jgi:hypothetical protein
MLGLATANTHKHKVDDCNGLIAVLGLATDIHKHKIDDCDGLSTVLGLATANTHTHAQSRRLHAMG